MKIVQINKLCGTSGIGRLTYELAEGLEKRGHQVLVGHSHGVSKYKNSIRIGNELDHKFHALMSRITGLQGYFSLFSTLRLVRKLKQFQPDVVHMHDMHSNYINLRILLRYLAKHDIAAVLTLHDCWYYTGKCTHYLPGNCTKWKEHCGQCPLLHKDNINRTYWFDRTKKCLKDKKKWFNDIPRLAVVGVSKWVASEAARSIHSSRQPVAVYNWVDGNVFRPTPSDLREKLGLNGKFVILMVAAVISPHKWYEEMTALADRLPDNWTIVAIGQTSMPMPANVIHIPHTSDAAELAMYYTMADVCLNTTRYETFGLVTAEAMSCGTPVVVYNNTAAPELVDSDCGFIIQRHGDMESIVEALNTICRNGKQKYAEHCKSSAKKRFDKDNGIDGYIRVYESLMKQKTREK